ncbi:MAG: hypothetical protein GY711_23955 [bacterium]|nr:hypothetical protein [bacterium]
MKTSLERAFDEAVGPYVEPCPTCGGPCRGANSYIKLGPGEEIPRCSECGEFVDREGQTLCQLVEGGVMPVILIRTA